MFHGTNETPSNDELIVLSQCKSSQKSILAFLITTLEILKFYATQRSVYFKISKFVITSDSITDQHSAEIDPIRKSGTH